MRSLYSSVIIDVWGVLSYLSLALFLLT